MSKAHTLVLASHKLPPLYSTENDADPVARVKLFSPDSSWTWYLTEHDPVSDLAFGLVQGHAGVIFLVVVEELGYINLQELRQMRGPLGLKIERDLHFKPTPLSKLRQSADVVDDSEPQGITVWNPPEGHREGDGIIFWG